MVAAPDPTETPASASAVRALRRVVPWAEALSTNNRGSTGRGGGRRAVAPVSRQQPIADAASRRRPRCSPFLIDARRRRPAWAVPGVPCSAELLAAHKASATGGRLDGRSERGTGHRRAHDNNAAANNEYDTRRGGGGVGRSIVINCAAERVPQRLLANGG